MPFFRATTFAVSIFLTALFGISYLINAIPIERGGISNKSYPVALRIKADAALDKVEYLRPNDFVPVHAVATRWIYIKYKDEVLALPKVHFDTGYVRILGLIVLRNYLWTQYSKLLMEFRFLLLVTGIAIFCILQFSTKRKAKLLVSQITVPLSNGSTEKLKIVPTQRAASSEPSFVKPIDKGSLKAEIEKEVVLRLKDEIRRKYQGRIDVLEADALKMRAEFAKAQKNALTLGVNLTDSKLDGLVKGRLFEVYAAKYWDADANLTILDWTPDKGFHNDIRVESNGNPDFLIAIEQKSNRCAIAVECKYRGSSFTLQKYQRKKFVRLEESWVIERYKKYGDDQGCAVFVLLGLGGDPAAPTGLYLIPVASILTIKTQDNYENLAMKERDLEIFKIHPENFLRIFQDACSKTFLD